MHSGDLRSTHGQASSDYVGVLAVIGAVVAVSATAIAPPPLAASIASAMRHAVCVVAGGVCTPREAQRARLAPCVVHSRSDGDSVAATIALVRLRRGDTAVVELRSDGTAVVSFTDSNVIGAQAGVGFSLKGAGGTGTAGMGAGISFNSGRAYEFNSLKAARRFLAEYGDDETTVGEALNAARGVSPLHQPERLPPPRSSTYEAGTWAQLEADVGLAVPGIDSRVSGEGDLAAGRLLGRRRSGGRVTWYLRVEDSAAAGLGLVVGAIGGGAQTDVVLELATERGRPVSATVSGVAGVSGEVGLYGNSADLAALARRLKQAGGGAGGSGRSGMAMQASVELDLTVPENRTALEGALEVLRLRVSPADVAARVDALGRRLDADGRVDVAFYRTRSSAKERSARLALGAEIGVEHVHSSETRELVTAWSAHGDALREREDCSEAASG